MDIDKYMKVSDKKVTRNFLWIIVGKILQAILGLIINRLTADYLGVRNYGVINYAMTLFTFVVPVAQLGLSVVIIQDVVENKDEEGEILGSAILCSLLTSGICYIGVLLFVAIINSGETDVLFCCIAYGIILFAQALYLIIYWYQAKLLSKYLSILSVIAYLVTTIYKVALLVNHSAIWLFALSYSIDYGVIAVIGLIIFLKKSRKPLKFSGKKSMQLLDKSKYFIIPNIMLTIFGQTDKVMLKWMMGNEEIGLYTAAYTCAGVLSFVFVAIIDSFRPVILESYKTSSHLFAENMKSLFSVLIYLSLVVCIVVTLLSDLIIILLYGIDYILASDVLKVTVWHTIFTYIGPARDTWILANRKQSILWKINLAGAIINIILNVIFIRLWGVIGAACASVISQICVYIILGMIVSPIKECTIMMIKSFNPKYFWTFCKSLMKG